MSVSVNHWSGLLPGFAMHPGETLVSKSGVYKLALQADGNLVALNGDDQPYWDSGTQGHPDAVLTLQEDGNLVLRDANGVAWWSTYTDAGNRNNDAYATLPQSPATFTVQDDGNVVLLRTDGAVLWDVWDDERERNTSAVNRFIQNALHSGLGGVIDAVKLLKEVLPVAGVVLAATTGDVELVAELSDAGNQLAALQPTLEQAYEDAQIVQQIGDGAKLGWSAAVGTLNGDVTPDQLEQVRAALPSDTDRAVWDDAIANASKLTDNPTSIAAAQTVTARRISASSLGKLAASSPRTTTTTTGKLNAIGGALPRATTTSVATLGALAGGAAAPKANTANILDVLAKATGQSKAAYVAGEQAKAAALPSYADAAGLPPAHEPLPVRPPSPSTASGGTGGVVLAAVIVLGLGAALAAR